MGDILTDRDFDTLFRNARSYNVWDSAATISDVQIQALYDLLRWGPTSANCSPARFVFVRTPEAKDKLAACVMPANAPKVRDAACTAIIGMDLKFYDRIPQLFPHNPGARDWFSGNEALARDTAFRNSSLQGAYLMMAARALGLDCGPMSGFDGPAVDAAFFSGTTVTTNFICALGTGTTENLFPRSPRLSFDEACQIV